MPDAVLTQPTGPSKPVLVIVIVVLDVVSRCEIDEESRVVGREAEPGKDRLDCVIE